MISRNRAELARDAAEHHRRTWQLHRERCDDCAVSIPCLKGMEIRRVMLAAIREAKDALTSYMPPGTPVTYHGPNPQHIGHTWTVTGPAESHPWAGYTIQRHRHPQVTAALTDLRLAKWEQEARARYAQVRDAVRLAQAVMARYGMVFSIDVDRHTSGRVVIVWSSAAMIGAEHTARAKADEQAQQYITAAMRLLRELRNATATERWPLVSHLARNARALADRARVAVMPSE